MNEKELDNFISLLEACERVDLREGHIVTTWNSTELLYTMRKIKK